MIISHVMSVCGCQENLLLSGQTKALDIGDFVEERGDGLLVHVEGQIAHKEGIALGAQLVVEFLGAIVGTIGWVVGRLARAKVQSHVATVEEATLLLLESSLRVLRAVEVDVTETSGTAVLGDDTSASETLAVLELLVEEIVIDIPAEVASEKGGALGRSIFSLGLLGKSLALIISLALLGGSLGLLLSRLRLGLVRVAVRVGARAGIGIGVIAAVRVGLKVFHVSWAAHMRALDRINIRSP